MNYWKFLVNEYTKFCQQKNNENLLFSSLISNNKEISIEEFIKRKLSNNSRATDSIISNIDEEINNYFNINTKTYSKIELINNSIKTNP